MNSQPPIPEATLQRVLASQRRPMRSRHIDGIVAARLASRFAEGLTLVAGAILGMRADEVMGKDVAADVESTR